MKRVSARELLDDDACPPGDVALSLEDIAGINRKFGGVSTTVELVRGLSRATGKTRLSLLDVGSGRGDASRLTAKQLLSHGISIELTFLDRARTHLLRGSRNVAGDALALPFGDAAFDAVSCNLFAHHLEPAQLALFVKEALRVSRSAVLINDLIRHRVHLALVYLGSPFMRSYVSRIDGAISVRKAYTPREIKSMVASAFSAGERPKLEVFTHYMFRMGVTIWKRKVEEAGK